MTANHLHITPPRHTDPTPARPAAEGGEEKVWADASAYFAELQSTATGSNAKNYRYFLHTFEAFSAGRHITLGHITARLVTDYRRHLLAAGLKATTSTRYVQIFRAMVRRAVRQGHAPAEAAQAFASIGSAMPRAVRPAAPQADGPARWYAFRLRPGVKAEALLSRASALAAAHFYPLEELARRSRTGSGVKLTTRPIIANTVFLRLGARGLAQLPAATSQLGALMGAKGHPSVIPDGQMQTFATVAAHLGAADSILPATAAEFAAGRRVRITDGPFAGYTGLVHTPASGGGAGTRLLIRLHTARFKVMADIPAPFIVPDDTEEREP